MLEITMTSVVKELSMMILHHPRRLSHERSLWGTIKSIKMIKERMAKNRTKMKDKEKKEKRE